ncbi:MAG TPA: hypothetical protein VKT70_07650, partial [Stellaceae bacterium]|nr:hypothetical protein [Stellaceae bacterium]
AELEWAVNEALHAEDVPPLDLASLAGLSDAAPDTIRFTPHPSLRLLAAVYPVDRIWRAIVTENEAALGAVDLAEGPHTLLIERTPQGVEVERIGEEEARFAAALLEGQTLAAALERAGTPDAATLLARTLSRGRIAAFRVGL